MAYAKLINGVFTPAPRKIQTTMDQDGETVDYTVYNPLEQQLAEAGYLPVVYADVPDSAPAGFSYESGWEEREGAIVQVWTLVTSPEELSDAEALEIITGGAV